MGSLILYPIFMLLHNNKLTLLCIVQRLHITQSGGGKAVTDPGKDLWRYIPYGFAEQVKVEVRENPEHVQVEESTEERS